jgi:hypothetical protein
VTFEDVARDSRFLLHRIDPVRRELEFRQTTAEAVRNAAFIDGRTDIWTEPPVLLPFDAAAPAAPAPAQSFRIIFHMNFCGSTLLARLLDAPGKVLALKEPNCLVDLGAWKTELQPRNGAATDFHSMLRLAVAMLGRRWAAGEEIVVKPPGWANNLIDDLVAASGGMRALFLTIARERFLEAVLRGGSERMAFTARLAAHLAPSVERGSERLQAAIDSNTEPMGKIARLALVAHDFELRLFERAIGRLDEAEIIDFAGLEESPFEAATMAAAALQLGLDQAEIEVNCDRWAQANVKADAAYSAAHRGSENAEVRATYGALIDDALAWAEDALGPATLQRA